MWSCNLSKHGKPRRGKSEEASGTRQRDKIRWRGEWAEGSTRGSKVPGGKVICSLKAFTLEANH